MTLEQVKADIAEGKSTLIYYSMNSLWWTHLTSDVEEAMKTGKEAMAKRHEELLAREDIPEDEKKRMKALKEMADSGAVEFPSDPAGSPLYQSEDLNGWIEAAEKKPEHFGKNGLEAFMKTHHQNCEGHCHTKWDFYNELVDKAKK